MIQIMFVIMDQCSLDLEKKIRFSLGRFFNMAWNDIKTSRSLIAAPQAND